MPHLEIGPIIPTRENVRSMVHMRHVMHESAPLAGWRDEVPLIHDPTVQYEALHTHPERHIGAYHDNQLVGFADLSDWTWGFQKEFETEFDYGANTGRPSLDRSDFAQIEDNPMGITSLLADELLSPEVGGTEEVLNILVKEAIKRSEGREIRTRVVAASAFSGTVDVANDPARRALESNGFESGLKTARIARINYELFIRAAS